MRNVKKVVEEPQRSVEIY